MVKGKVQPSEKYIYKNMLPYTSAQNYQSIAVKSSTNRHHLVLKQQSPKVISSNQPIPKKSTHEGNVKGGGRLNIKQKKLKGSKMSRA